MSSSLSKYSRGADLLIRLWPSLEKGSKNQIGLLTSFDVLATAVFDRRKRGGTSVYGSIDDLMRLLFFVICSRILRRWKNVCCILFCSKSGRKLYFSFKNQIKIHLLL